MAKEWCVKGMQISLSASGMPVTFAVPGAGPVFVTEPSAKTKIDSKGVYFGAVTFTFSGTVWNGLQQNAVGTITFNLLPVSAKAKYSKENGLPILIAEDEADSLVPVTYQAGSTSTAVTVHARISNPGQTSIKEK